MTQQFLACARLLPLVALAVISANSVVAQTYECQVLEVDPPARSPERFEAYSTVPESANAIHHVDALVLFSSRSPGMDEHARRMVRDANVAQRLLVGLRRCRDGPDGLHDDRLTECRSVLDDQRRVAADRRHDRFPAASQSFPIEK